jgi:hypothetical protein
LLEIGLNKLFTGLFPERIVTPEAEGEEEIDSNSDSIGDNDDSV